MFLSLTKPTIPVHWTFSKRKKVSLSTYFPKGTQYFYGYPAGEDSGFLNQVPPAVEELVAERAISCAGEHVSIVGFAATNPPYISASLLEDFSMPQLDPRQLIVLPQEIDANVEGAERNRIIKDSLRSSVARKSLVMAQPYTGEDMQEVYQIPPELTTWLNDKSNMSQFMREDLLPRRLGLFKNGREFAHKYNKLSPPFVVKASASSSGDGVYICLNDDDVKEAVSKLKNVRTNVLIEQHIEACKNYGVHFGISHNDEQEVDLLGVNEQLTTPEGKFIGGIIRSATIPAELTEIEKYLLGEVLPVIRRKGWYGVGCFDVLLDRQGKFYFIDSNFRMTGMSAYHFLVANKTIKTPLIGFSGEFIGNQAEFEERLLPLAGKNAKTKILQLIALSQHDKCWNFNGALFFDNGQQMFGRIKQLLDSGVASHALELLLKNGS